MSFITLIIFLIATNFISAAIAPEISISSSQYPTAVVAAPAIPLSHSFSKRKIFNCQGNMGCRGAHMRQINAAVQSQLKDDAFYEPGFNIACVLLNRFSLQAVCLHIKRTEVKMDGKSIKRHMQILAEFEEAPYHSRCLHCGSIPIGFPVIRDGTEGELSVNLLKYSGMTGNRVKESSCGHLPDGKIWTKPDTICLDCEDPAFPEATCDKVPVIPI